MSKTITLDQKAYKALKSHKFREESFSDVIKKLFIPSFLDVRRWKRFLAYVEGPRATRRSK